jgi:hypothetical protein
MQTNIFTQIISYFHWLFFEKLLNIEVEDTIEDDDSIDNQTETNDLDENEFVATDFIMNIPTHLKINVNEI